MREQWKDVDVKESHPSAPSWRCHSNLIVVLSFEKPVGMGDYNVWIVCHFSLDVYCVMKGLWEARMRSEFSITGTLLSIWF